LCGQVREGGRDARKVIAQGYYFVLRWKHHTLPLGEDRHFINTCTQTNSLLTGYHLDDRGSFLRRSMGFYLATESIPVLRRTKSCSGDYPKADCV
jgi:hypothetical protein